MKHFSKIFMLGVVLALFLALTIPISAQSDVVEPTGPGEGGTIVESNVGDDPSTFNPLYSNDTVSSLVHNRFYPSLIGTDPVTFTFQPDVKDALAKSWEYDDTGTILTVHLRQDMYWSDGVQITADDYLWAADAIKSGTTSSPRTDAFYKLDDGTISGGPITKIVKIDDFTLEFHLGVVATDDNGDPILDDNGDYKLITSCDAIAKLDNITPVPAHAFQADFGDNYSAMDGDPYYFPKTDNGPASFGPFTDPFIDFGVGTSLVADQNFTDTNSLPYVAAGEWYLQTVASQDVEYERFLAGDFSMIGIPTQRQNEFRQLADESGDYNYIEYPANGYGWMAMNEADPKNPQNGSDANGLIDQGMHPIFGDVRVRVAIAYGVDIMSMIGTRPDGDKPATGIFEGNGYPIATHDHPVFSTTADILKEMGVVPRPYDPEKAKQMLDEAGWTDQNGDGVRECHGCLYATQVDPSYEGSPMEFELLTNSSSDVRVAMGESIRAQLGEIGITVNFQAIEFGTLIQELLSQEYDAIIIGWSLGLPFLPGDSLNGLFDAPNDRVGAGFNFTSYQNPDFVAKLKEGDTYPGCDPDARNHIYAEAQKMLYDDEVYLFLPVGNTMVAAPKSLGNFDPIPNNVRWNMDDWVVTNFSSDN